MSKTWGYSWRSSTSFIIICIGIALFAESFLYGFIVPILPYILEFRNHVASSELQRYTYFVLTTYGFVAVLSAVFIGHFADRAKSRKGPLILGLAIAFVGTLILAASTHLVGVFIGRVLQGVGGTAAWIVGVTTLRDSIDASDMGKTFGFVHSCVSVGSLSGPAVAGILLDKTNYWITWGAVFLVLLLDIVMRLAMIEKPKKKKVKATRNGNGHPTSNGSTESTDERRPLINGSEQSYDSDTTDETTYGEEMSTAAFYKLLLSRPRVMVGVTCSVVSSIMLASYNTTIPTHVMFTFGWGSFVTGLLFVGIQGPTIIFGPVAGWLRDKVGTKIPTTIGFTLLTPLIWLLGAADQQQYPWASSKEASMRTYVIALVGIGCVTNMTGSAATIEITSAVDDIEKKSPGIFGPNGAYSRCYSLSNLAFASGLLLGPLISGSLTDALGYYRMNWVLAGISLITAILAGIFLGGKSALAKKEPRHHDEDEA